MSVVFGVDIGSSTTKIVAMDGEKKILSYMRISASDQVTSMFGAVGKMMYDLELQPENVNAVMITGVGSSFTKGDIYAMHTYRVVEFDALAAGGLYLADLSEAIVGSIGTGTVFVHTDGQKVAHMGGSAVGGGTLVGLSSRLFGIDKVNIISDMASKGNLKNVDWGISEVSSQGTSDDEHHGYVTIPDYATASNLGKMKSTATDEDVALGLLNMIYQTAGTLAVFISRQVQIKDIVMTGSLATLPHAKIMLGQVGELYNVNFIIPEEAAFATAIGAALLYFRESQD